MCPESTTVTAKQSPGRGKRLLAFACITVIVVVVLIELMLSLLAAVIPKVNTALSSPWEEGGKPPIIPLAIPHDELGARPNPAYPGHDRNGFRNPRVPTRAGVVALGDSQTYGVGVVDDATWPRQAEAMLNDDVYNMSLGGYGPAHYRLLFDEALTLQPHTIVMAFYSGNDLYDTFNLVYTRGNLQRFQSREGNIRDAVAAAEGSEPLRDKSKALFPGGWVEERARDTTDQDDESGDVAENGDTAANPMHLISKYSTIYGLLRRIRFELSHRKTSKDPWPWSRVLRFAEQNGEGCEVFEGESHKTVFTPRYRRTVLDLQDVRVREGLRMSLAAIRECAQSASRSNVRLIVALIPTKELTFSEIVLNPSSDYASLILAETRVWSEIKRFLQDNDIEFIDTLPAIRSKIAAGKQPYPMTFDGHPNKDGHEAIAVAISEQINRRTSRD